MNQNTYENLSPWLKQVFAQAATAQAEETTAEFRYNNTIALSTLVERGAVLSAFPPEVIEAIGGAAAK